MNTNPENVVDLLSNELFVKWIRTSDQELDLYWRRWLQEHPEKAGLVAMAKSLVESVKYERDYSINDDDYNSTLNTILLFNNDSGFVQEERRKTESRRRIVWAAAVVTIMVCVGGILNLIYNKEIPVNDNLQYITKVVPKGVKTTLILPDGTRVKLNSSSSLKYPSAFSSASRDVYLTGQAFFDVREDQKVPFLVHTKNFTTKVMGTSFDVRSYEDEQAQHVAVVTGKVKVEALNGLSEVLVHDEMTEYKNNEMVRTSGFNRNFVLGWKDGLLQFNDSDFHDVTEQLSLWYGVEFDIEKRVKIKGRYTGSFRDESLENVLRGISFSSSFTFSIEDKIVRITQPK